MADRSPSPPSTTASTHSIPYRKARQESKPRAFEASSRSSSLHSSSEDRGSQAQSSPNVESAPDTNFDSSDYAPRKPGDQDEDDSVYSEIPPQVKTDVRRCFQCHRYNLKCNREQPECRACRITGIQCYYPRALPKHKSSTETSNERLPPNLQKLIGESYQNDPTSIDFAQSRRPGFRLYKDKTGTKKALWVTPQSSEVKVSSCNFYGKWFIVGEELGKDPFILRFYQSGLNRHTFSYSIYFVWDGQESKRGNKIVYKAISENDISASKCLRMIERIQRAPRRNGFSQDDLIINLPDHSIENSDNRPIKRPRVSARGELTHQESFGISGTPHYPQVLCSNSLPIVTNSVSHHSCLTARQTINRSDRESSGIQEVAGDSTIVVDSDPGLIAEWVHRQTSILNDPEDLKPTAMVPGNSPVLERSIWAWPTPESSSEDRMFIFQGPFLERKCPFSQCPTVDKFLKHATIAGIYDGTDSDLQCRLSTGTVKHIMSEGYNQEKDFETLKALIEQEIPENVVVTEWKLT